MIARFTTNSRDSRQGRVFPARAAYGLARASARTAWKFGAKVAIAVTDDRRVDGGRFARRIEVLPIRLRHGYTPYPLDIEFGRVARRYPTPYIP